MARKIPSTNALICLECVARHGSVTLAAEELCLTQGAVSRQIRRLEGYLGIALFRRLKQRMYLTEQGRAYVNAITPLLQKLESLTLAITTPDEPPVKLGAEPSIRAHLLLPNMHQFSAQHPDIQLDVVSELTALYLEKTGYDIGILYGDGQWDGFQADYLLGGDMWAVCAPALRERLGVVKGPSEVVHYPILHHQNKHAPHGLSSTALWLEHMGFTRRDIEAWPGQHFEHYQFALEAAILGHGLTVLPRFFIHAALKRGDLVLAQNTPLSLGDYYLVTRCSEVDRQEVQAVRQWLLHVSAVSQQ